MTDQIAMTGAEAYQIATGRVLTPRQQLVFDFVRDHDGVSADEVGALLHAYRERRPHGVDERCEYCARDGRSALISAALKPLIRYRRNPRGGRLYMLRNPAPRVSEPLPGESWEDAFGPDSPLTRAGKGSA